MDTSLCIIILLEYNLSYENVSRLYTYVIYNVYYNNIPIDKK